jgi:aminoacrylate hydrolase
VVNQCSIAVGSWQHPHPDCNREQGMAVLKRPDGEIYYERSGHGPPVLLIQGIGVVGECWRPQVTRLAQNYETVLFDNRGIGPSLPCHGPISMKAMAEDALALMDALGWESAHLIGHSMGGVIAQGVAVECPNRVRSLSLVCTFPRGSRALRVTPWVLWAMLRTRIGTRRMRRRAFLRMLWSSEGLQRTDMDELAVRVARFIGRDLADQPRVMTRQLLALAKSDFSARLRGISGIPSLVISAEHDPIARPRDGQALAPALS